MKARGRSSCRLDQNTVDSSLIFQPLRKKDGGAVASLSALRAVRAGSKTAAMGRTRNLGVSTATSNFYDHGNDAEIGGVSGRRRESDLHRDASVPILR